MPFQIRTYKSTLWLVFLLLFLIGQGLAPVWASQEKPAQAAQEKPAKPAAQKPAQPAPDKSAGAKFMVVPVLEGYPAGKKTAMYVLVSLPPGMVLASPEKGQAPVKLGLAENNGVKLAEIALLPPFEGEAHKDKALLRLAFQVEPKAEPGKRAMQGMVSLLGQDGKKLTQQVVLPLEVLAADQESKVMNQRMLAALDMAAGIESNPAPAAGAKAASPKEEDPFAGKSIWLLLGLVLAAGLGLNLTPCVYPLIPITVSFFAGRSGGSRAQTMGHALLYWAGMVTTYTLLGAVISVSGQMLGQALTSPAVVVFIALVILVMASSMFGFWEIRLPAALNRLAGQSKSGYWGTAFMGLTVGLLAAPCVGPFVVGLMTHVALKGSLAYGLLVFFTLSFGLGLPLAVMAFFSGSISRLPGAGGWMIWVRRLFGVVLVMMAIYILQPLLSKDAYRFGMALAALIGGLYLAFLEKSGQPGFKIIKLTLGLCLAVGAGVFLFLTQAPQAGLHHIQWTPYTDEVMAEARQKGRPVFVDISAEWCAPCRQMEATTFVDPQVVKLLGEFKTVKVDVTNGAPAAASRALQTWQVRGVPTMLFFDQKGRWIRNLTIVGYAPPDRLIRYMEAALKKGG